MEKIEKAIKVLAQLSEDHMCDGLSEEESNFVLTYNISVPLAWLVENGDALATERGNEQILNAYNAYITEFGGNNE